MGNDGPRNEGSIRARVRMQGVRVKRNSGPSCVGHKQAGVHQSNTEDRPGASHQRCTASSTRQEATRDHLRKLTSRRIAEQWKSREMHPKCSSAGTNNEGRAGEEVQARSRQQEPRLTLVSQTRSKPDNKIPSRQRWQNHIRTMERQATQKRVSGVWGVRTLQALDSSEEADEA